MEKMKRTVTCGELTAKNAETKVTLNGWVHRNRDHGGIHFINLRDRYGITQIVINPDAADKLLKIAGELKFEYCIAVSGTVKKRPDTMINKDMITGEIEIEADDIEILSTCEVLPFMIDENSEAKEDLRLRYRYLDLRSASMQRRIKLRHDVALTVREYLSDKGFYEIETPTLIKSTPEGARDFLVPSRLHPGRFYALPQSPQLYKQMIMVSGFDKYFQIAHCYRDEDARGDRQLEHTQIDIEMSFVSKEDIFSLIEGMMSFIFNKTMDVSLATPFIRIPYKEAMALYGSDKPDLRFDMKMQDFSPYVPAASFQVFKTVLENNGAVKALVVPGCSGYSRKMITELEDTAKTYGAKGLAWMKVKDNSLEGGISKFYENQSDAIIKDLGAENDDLILIVGDSRKTASISLGAVRTRLGTDLKLIDDKIFKFCWIVDFPLFEWDSENEKWDAVHHMFSMPQDQYLETMEENPGEVKGDLYDLVCNGLELASGSIRIHNPDIQKRIFNIVGYSEEEAEKRFGFLLNAFKYGAPPHGGIAPGLDRLVMIMTGEKSIKEVIAFPKNTVGISPMDEAPALVDQNQLDELHLLLKPVNKS